MGGSGIWKGNFSSDRMRFGSERSRNNDVDGNEDCCENIYFFVTKQYNFTYGKCNRDDSISFRNVNITIMR